MGSRVPSIDVLFPDVPVELMGGFDAARTVPKRLRTTAFSANHCLRLAYVDNRIPTKDNPALWRVSERLRWQ
jgi:hypothetical protein